MADAEKAGADPKAPEPGRYRKRPVVVEAVRFDPEQFEALKAAGYPLRTEWRGRAPEPSFVLWTAKSSAYCAIATGEYILHEPDGKGFYPCTAAAFATTYEAVNGAEAPNAELPATPEPATPAFTEFERGVLSRLEWTDALHATYFAVFRTQAPESMKACDISHAIVDAITDARDAVGDPLFQRLLATHSQEQGETRAQVAELEARIAEIQIERDAAVARYVRDFVNWDARVQNARGERDEARAALARANEALRSTALNVAADSISAYAPAVGALERLLLHFEGSPDVRPLWSPIEVVQNALAIVRGITTEGLAGAQGSAAQKPEGP